jgi:hypothetical protein
VASASARIAEAITFVRAESGRDEDHFTEEVVRELSQRKVEVERSHSLIGASGHEHQPALFVPSAELVIEPISAEAAWNRATAVYAEFGDLAQANGYNLMAVVDDRLGMPAEQILKLISQVGSIAEWSRRSQWLDRFVSGPG